MVRINRVYTRTGDEGETGLVGGSRVPKDSPSIHAFGTLDELNSFVGLARAEIPSGCGKSGPSELDDLSECLLWIQHKLFDVGAFLATPAGESREKKPSAGPGDVKMLERTMDDWTVPLPELDSFLLPGGGKLGAWLHVCRAVCRRGEREICRLHATEAVDADVLRFVNRLSDFFFVAARHAARLLGESEVKWKPSPGV